MAPSSPSVAMTSGVSGGPRTCCCAPTAATRSPRSWRLASEHQRRDRAARWGVELLGRDDARRPAGCCSTCPGSTRSCTSTSQNRRARVEPGVVNSDLQAHWPRTGLCFSPDPGVGASGHRGRQHHRERRRPARVEVRRDLQPHPVRRRGAARRVDHHLRADDEGPDLLGVLIGSEGTLGIVTEATVALRPIAEVTHSLMGAFASAREAADTIAAIIATGVVPAAVEWLDRAGIAGLQQFYDTGYPLDADSIVLIDVDGTAAEVARDQAIVERVLRERATEVRIAEDEKDRAALWYGRLNAPNSVVQSGKGFFIGDVTVPRDRIPEMQEAIQATAERHRDGLLFIAVCGHAGDGDLHPTTFYDKDNPLAASALEAANNEIIEAALALGGTITGEHGVGTEKIQFMTKRFTPVEIAAQRAIKTAFDPAGILNPGVMLPEPSPTNPTPTRSAPPSAMP